MSWFFCVMAWFALQTPVDALSKVRAEWRESIELDLPADVVRAGRALLATDSAWKQDAQALALFARALSATGGDVEAFELLSQAQVPVADRGYIEVALARLELQADRLEPLIRRLSTTKGPAGEQAPPVRFPELADSWWLLGKALTRQGNPEIAAPYLQRFVQGWRLHPEAPAAWHLLSQQALAGRDLKAANTYREQGQNLSTWHGYYKTRRLQVRQAPADPLPRYGLAQLWSSVQEYEKASLEIERTLALDSEFARAWALKGELERKQNRMDSALEAYGRALELDASLGDARFNRALLALRAGMQELAEADLVLIVDGPESTAPRYLTAHLELARLFKELGKLEQAEKRHGRYRQLGGTEAL